MRRRSRFRALTLLVVVALSAAPSLAGGREMARRSTEARGVFASLWQALSEFLPLPGKDRGAWDSNGALVKGRGTIDPDGAPAPAAPAESESDGRSTIDPNG
jgi:hypothetical protein